MANPLLDVEKNSTFVASVMDRRISSDDFQIVFEDVVFEKAPYGVGDGLRVLLLRGNMTEKTVSRFCDEGVVVLRNDGLTTTTILIRLDD